MKLKLWSIEELELLKINYPNSSSATLKSLFKERSSVAIGAKAREIGLKKSKWWTDDELKILKDNYAKVDNKIIVTLINKPLDSIQHKAMELNIIKDKFWKVEEIENLKIIYKDYPLDELSIILDRPIYSIITKLKNLSLKRGYKFTKRNSNVSSLLNESLDAFYWIGFLFADGHFKKDNKTIMLSLANKDIIHLEKFCEFIKLDKSKIKYYCGKNNISNFFEANKIEVRDCELIPLIIKKFDIHSNKTYNPPIFSKYNFSNEQMLSLLIGFIDGDGSIGHYGKTSRITVGCHFSWKDNFKYWHKLIYNIIDQISTPKPIIKNNQIKMSFYKIDIIRALVTFIKINNLPILKRKWCQLPFF